MTGEGFGERPLAEDDQLGRIEGGSEPIESEYPLDPIYFDYDSSALSDATLAALEEHARWILAHPRAHVIVEGHCDERGTTEYNLNLGARRAGEVRDHLVRLGVAESRLETITYGEERPAVPGSSPEAWAKNRRAEFRVEER